MVTDTFRDNSSKDSAVNNKLFFGKLKLYEYLLNSLPACTYTEFLVTVIGLKDPVYFWLEQISLTIADTECFIWLFHSPCVN